MHLCTKAGNYASAVRLFREMIRTKVNVKGAASFLILHTDRKAKLALDRILVSCGDSWRRSRILLFGVSSAASGCTEEMSLEIRRGSFYWTISQCRAASLL